MKNFISYMMWLCLFILFPLNRTPSQNKTVSIAEGHLIVAGGKVQIKHAYIWTQEGFFDKTKEDIVVIVTNIPLPDRALEDRWVRNDMVREGSLKFVEIIINSEKQPISVSVKHPAFKASPSGFSSHYKLELQTFNEKFIAGRMYCDSEQEFFDTFYTFDFTFEGEVKRKKVLPAPTEDEKDAAATSHQAAIYLRFVKAVSEDDVNTLKKVLASDVAEVLNGPDGEELLEFMKIENYPKAEFQRIVVEGDRATLMLEAQDEGYELSGKIEFIKEGDLWKITHTSWEEK